MSRQGGTVESVQALRAVAAIVVALFHCQLAYARVGRVDMHSAETYIFGFGAVGVHVFFVISGFIMVATNPDPQRFSPTIFYWRRLARIYPIYWICCLLALSLHAGIGNAGLLSRQTGLALALYPADSASIIGSGWTLPFELYFYLCFGLALVVFRRRALPVLTAFFLFCSVVGTVHHWKSDWMHILSNPLLLEFLMGAGIAKLTERGNVSLQNALGVSLIAVMLFAGGLLFGYHRLPSLLVWGIPSGLLVLGLIWTEKVRGAGLITTTLGRLGDSSYVLYLLHPVIIVTAINASIVSRVLWLGPVSGSIMIVALSVALAHIMHRKIEAPMLRWLKSQWPRRRSMPTLTAETEPVLV